MASAIDQAMQWVTARRYERQVPCVCGGRTVCQSTAGDRVCLQCGAKTTHEQADAEPRDECDNSRYPDLCGQLVNLVL